MQREVLKVLEVPRVLMVLVPGVLGCWCWCWGCWWVLVVLVPGVLVVLVVLVPGVLMLWTCPGSVDRLALVNDR